MYHDGTTSTTAAAAVGMLRYNISFSLCIGRYDVRYIREQIVGSHLH